MADPVTSDPIRAAVEQLRADLDSLPKDLAADSAEGIDGRWEAMGSYPSPTVGVPIHDGGSAFLHVATCEDSYDDSGRALAEHIARTASPDVTEALVRHLALIDRETPFESDAEMERWAIAVQESAIALAEAITHRRPA